ncbi:hypothetical protein [Haloferula helveola]|uniref:hypothetical protein n=1 Tax=Haloferula helveola TaxID=490095 RepID=UPI0030CA90B6
MAQDLKGLPQSLVVCLGDEPDSVEVRSCQPFWVNWLQAEFIIRREAGQSKITCFMTYDVAAKVLVITSLILVAVTSILALKWVGLAVLLLAINLFSVALAIFDMPNRAVLRTLSNQLVSVGCQDPC